MAKLLFFVIINIHSCHPDLWEKWEIGNQLNGQSGYIIDLVGIEKVAMIIRDNIVRTFYVSLFIVQGKEFIKKREKIFRNDELVEFMENILWQVNTQCENLQK